MSATDHGSLQGASNMQNTPYFAINPASAARVSSTSDVTPPVVISRSRPWPRGVRPQRHAQPGGQDRTPGEIGGGGGRGMMPYDAVATLCSPALSVALSPVTTPQPTPEPLPPTRRTPGAATTPTKSLPPPYSVLQPLKLHNHTPLPPSLCSSATPARPGWTPPSLSLQIYHPIAIQT